MFQKSLLPPSSGQPNTRPFRNVCAYKSTGSINLHTASRSIIPYTQPRITDNPTQSWDIFLNAPKLISAEDNRCAISTWDFLGQTHHTYYNFSTHTYLGLRIRTHVTLNLSLILYTYLGLDGLELRLNQCQKIPDNFCYKRNRKTTA